MLRYCTILPHAPLPCAAIMQCRGIAPFYPTLLSLVLLLCHVEVLHHSTPRSSPLCYYYGMPMYCTILPHAPLPCAAIMPCRGIAPFYPTLPSLVLLLCHAEVLHHSTPSSSLVLLLCHAEVLHHSTPRSSPVCCYYAMPRYCTILPHAPLPCAAIMPCRGIAPFYLTLLSLVLLLCHAEVLHHSTHAPPVCCYYGMPRYCTILPHAPPVCCYYAMPSYCTILPHAPLPCAVIMACRGIAPFYPTLLSLVLLLWHAEVLHHSTPRASPLCCYYGMPIYCTILPHAPLPCAAVMPCRGIAPFYPTLLPCAAIMPCRAIAPFYPTLLSLVLLLWHAEVLHHSTPRSSRVLLVWHAEVLHHSTSRSSPLCCYYGMPMYCTILPHAPLPCAAIMPCRGIAPFYPTLLSLVLLLCHVEVSHHSTPRSSRVLLLWHAEVLHHSTSRSSPLCCYYGMPRYCTILPHAPLPCAAIMPCR